MIKRKDKTLTTRFEAQTMAEFSVAVELLGFRSINALVHQMVHQKIREAKNLATAEEFAEMVERQKAETESRSEIKSKERSEMLGELLPRSNSSLPMMEINLEAPKKKKRA